MSARLGVLLSGRGSNFLALADAIDAGGIPAEIAVVVSNVPDAPGLESARERGLATRSVPHGRYADRSDHDRAVADHLHDHGVTWVCLAGYMRILGPELVDAFPQRMLNIHPSLLPSFPGLHAQRQALEHGVRVAGCTVHLVDSGLDSGPIVAQRAVSVADDDTEERLAERILEQEHLAYPQALARLLTEPWRVSGRRVVFGPDCSSEDRRKKV